MLSIILNFLFKNILIVATLSTVLASNATACIVGPKVINLDLDTAEEYGYEINIRPDESDESCDSCILLEIRAPVTYQSNVIRSVLTSSSINGIQVSRWGVLDVNESNDVLGVGAILRMGPEYKYTVELDYGGPEDISCMSYKFIFDVE